jgi:hypothetical protein
MQWRKSHSARVSGVENGRLWLGKSSELPISAGESNGIVYAEQP